MNAGQLAKILQSVEPSTPIGVSIAMDIDDRKDIICNNIDNIDAFAQMEVSSVSIDEIKGYGVQIEICVFPT
jgi:hypothetical protein